MAATDNLLPAIYRWCRFHRVALSWSVVGVAVALTIVLGVIGFAELNDPPLPFSTRLYQAIQLLTMRSGALTDQPQVSWTLQVARYAGVVASLGTVLNALLVVFGRRIHGFLVRRRTHHAVVCGVGHAGAQLATDLLAEGHRVTFIEIAEGNPAVAALLERGAHEVIGNASDPQTLEAAAVHNADILVVVAGSDTQNIEIVSAANHVCRNRDGTAAPLRCYVHIVDERLKPLLDQRPDDNATPLQFETSTFNRFENSARLLLAETPLDRERISTGDPDQVHLVIIDLNQMGEALLKQAMAIGHFGNHVPLAVTLIDKAAQRKEKRLLSRMPELHRCADLTFINGEVQEDTVRKKLRGLLNDPCQTVSIAVCSDDGHTALTTAMDLVPFLTSSNSTLFVNLADDEGVATLLGRFSHDDTTRMHPFGGTDTACSPRAIVRQELDTLARKIHDAYRAKRARDGDSRQKYPAMRPWEELDGELRDMNRQQADHIPVKLRALGWQMVAGSTGGDVAPLGLGDDEIEILAKAEHRRWCASRRLAGWQFGSTRDDGAKLHPDLVPWEELTEATRDYDREPVRNLPQLLETIGCSIQRHAE